MELPKIIRNSVFFLYFTLMQILLINSSLNMILWFLNRYQANKESYFYSPFVLNKPNQKFIYQMLFLHSLRFYNANNILTL